MFIAFHLRLEKGSWQSFAQVDSRPFELAFFVWAYSGGFGQQLARMAKVGMSWATSCFHIKLGI